MTIATDAEPTLNVEDLLARLGLRYCVRDNGESVEIDIYSNLSDDAVDPRALDMACALLAGMAEQVAGGEHQRRIAAMHLNVMVQKG